MDELFLFIFFNIFEENECMMGDGGRTLKSLVLWMVPLKDVLQWTMSIEGMLKAIGGVMVKGNKMDDKME